MFYFFGVKGVIRSNRYAQELKADTLTPASHLALTTSTPLTTLTPKKLNCNFNPKLRIPALSLLDTFPFLPMGTTSPPRQGHPGSDW